MVQPLEIPKGASLSEAEKKPGEEEVADVTEFLEEDEPSIKNDSQLSRAEMEAAGLISIQRTDDEARATQDIQDSINSLTKQIEEGELSSDDLIDITDRIQKLEHSAQKAKQEARLEKIEESGSVIGAYLDKLSEKAIIRQSDKAAELKKGKRLSIGNNVITIKNKLGAGAFGSVFDAVDTEGNTRAVKLTSDVLVTDQKPNTRRVDYRIREGLIGSVMAEGEIINKTEQSLIKSSIGTAISKLKPELKRKEINDALDQISKELLKAKDTEEFQDILDKYRDDYPPYLVKDYFRATIGKTRKVHAIPKSFGEQLVESRSNKGGKRIQLALMMENIAEQNKNRRKGEKIDDFHHLESSLAEEDKAKVGMGTIFAIRKLHKRGIAMRDIKPANIMVDPLAPGNVKVFDFGLSASEYDKSMVSEGEVVGTPTFIAPEAAAGETTNLKVQDIYSLGMTLYEGFFGSEGIYHALEVKKPSERPNAMLRHVYEKGTSFAEIDFLSKKSNDTAEPFQRGLLMLIEKMTDGRPESRPDIDQVAAAFHKLYSEYQSAHDLEEIPLDLDVDEEEIQLDSEKTIAKKKIA